jgi:hypothetical protein
MLYVVEREIPHGDGVRSEGGIGSDMISLLYNIRLCPVRLLGSL